MDRDNQSLVFNQKWGQPNSGYYSPDKLEIFKRAKDLAGIGPEISEEIIYRKFFQNEPAEPCIKLTFHPGIDLSPFWEKVRELGGW